MTATRNVIIAGAGIGGLTAALTLARAGLRATVLEQAPQLEEAGAGIQLTPNATRILLQLGLGDELRRTAVEPEAIRVLASEGRITDLVNDKGKRVATGRVFHSVEPDEGYTESVQHYVRLDDGTVVLARSVRGVAGRATGSRCSPGAR